MSIHRPAAGTQPATRRARRRLRRPPCGRSALRTLARSICAVLLVALAACGGSLDQQLENVRDIQASGDFAASIEPLRTILARDPGLAEANYLLGLALVQTGRPVLATVPLEKAAATEEFATAAGTLLAAVLASRQEHEAAAAAAERVLERDPGNVLALQVRAASELRMGDAEQALADARRAIDSSPNALQARVFEAVALHRLGREGEAELAEKRLAETAREVGGRPAEIRSCVMLALLHHELGDVERGGEVIGSCLDRFPTEPFVLQQTTTLYDAANRSEEATQLWRRAIELAPDEPALRYLLAERLVRRGRPNEAESVLQQAVEHFGDAASFAQLARFHQRFGRLDRAFEELAKARAAASDESPELDLLEIELLIDRGDLDAAGSRIAALDSPFQREILQGRLLAARGDDAAALASLESAFARGPATAAARYLAGSIAERLGQTDKAIFHYQQAAAVDPGATDAAVDLAEIWLSRGQPAQALGMAQLALAARPTSRIRALELAARAHMAQGQFDQARPYIDALDQQPGGHARAVLERASLAAETGGPAAVVETIEQSGLDLDEARYEPLLRRLAESLVLTGRGEEALRRLDAALAHRPDSAALHDARARVLIRMGRLDEARATFREALRLEPDYASALAGLGTLAAREGNPEEAIALLDRANADGLRDVEGALLAASLVDQQGRIDEAEERLRTVVRAAPGNASALNDLAWILANRGRDLDGALELAERAVERSPRAEMLDTLGWVRLQRDEPALAVGPLERALEEKPDASGTRYRLGLALQALGRNDEARAAFERALEDPSLPQAEAEKARAALEQLGQS